MLSFIVVSWFLNFGYVPEMANMVDQQYYGVDQFSGPTIVVDSGLEFTMFDKFSVFTSMKSYAFFLPVKTSLLDFSPFSMAYTIGTSYKIDENIDIELKHVCQHPVVPQDYHINYMYNYGETDLTINIHGKMRLQ